MSVLKLTLKFKVKFECEICLCESENSKIKHPKARIKLEKHVLSLSKNMASLPIEIGQPDRPGRHIFTLWPDICEKKWRKNGKVEKGKHFDKVRWTVKNNK